MNVVHDTQQKQFVVELEADNAFVKYRMLNEHDVDFYSTFVPRSARGKGIAEKLVDEALQWARDEAFQLHASCWYVEKRLAEQAKLNN